MTDELRARFEAWAVLYELQADLIAWHTWQACAADMQDVQRDAVVIRGAVGRVISAVRAYLPPDGISKDDCLNRVIEAVDNPETNKAMP